LLRCARNDGHIELFSVSLKTQSAAHRAERKQQIVEALTEYRAERDAWDGLF
jgi:hypothetical protein